MSFGSRQVNSRKKSNRKTYQESRPHHIPEQTFESIGNEHTLSSTGNSSSTTLQRSHMTAYSSTKACSLHLLSKSVVFK